MLQSHLLKSLILTLMSVASWCRVNASVVAGEDGKSSALPNTDDVMALLEASYAKVRVVGAANGEVSLAVVDERGKAIAVVQKLKLGPSGAGDLCVLAKNAEGIISTEQRVRIVFTWNTPPFVQKGQLAFSKFWDFRKGSTFTDGFTEETFNSPQINWNVSDQTRCEITRIWWSPSKISGLSAPGHMQQVGAIVLERLP